MQFSTTTLLAIFGATVSMASPINLGDAHVGAPTAFNDNNDIVARFLADRELEPRDSKVVSQGPVYVNSILQHHNIHRANHTVANLVWNSTLAPYAQSKANTCQFDHSQPAGLTITTGQNIASGTYMGPSNISVAITDLFYNNEFGAYSKISSGFTNGSPNTNDASDPFEDWGHITQLVWGNTKSVACGTSQCSNGLGYFTACLYYPPGNYLGNFAQVKKPIGFPVLHGTYTNN